MRKITAFLCAVIMCVTCACGCQHTMDTNTTQPTASSATADETTFVVTTVSATTEVLTTAPTEPSDEPERPEYVSHKATGDEAGKYKYVAFSFDDGPHYDLTYKFVDKLAQYGGVGTFYVVGNRVKGKQADAVKYAFDKGNEIGVHAWTHTKYYNTCFDSVFRSELDKTDDVIRKVTGVKPISMRPVGGAITNERVKSSGYAVVIWNVDSNDWRYSSSAKGNVDTIVNNVMRSVSDGDIILMHEIYYNSYDAFCIIADRLYKQGYRFITVEELLDLKEADRGTRYYSAK